MSVTSEPLWLEVHNDEEQYSVWRSDLALPPGWISTGYQGSRDDCLDHIATVWTDMRPRSLREFENSRRRDGEQEE